MTIGLQLRSLIVILFVFELLSLCGYLIMWINSNKDNTSSMVNKFTRVTFLIYQYGIVIITYFIVQMNKALTESNVDSDLDKTLKMNYT